MSKQVPFVAWCGDTMPIAIKRAQALGLPFSHLFDHQDRRVVRSQDGPMYLVHNDNVSAIAENKGFVNHPSLGLGLGLVHPTIAEKWFCGSTQQELDDAIVAEALRILRERTKPGVKYDNPQTVRDMLAVAYTDQEHETFSVTFLDSQLCFIQHVSLFQGTLTQTSVYPREVIKLALKLNAGAVILAHNHPSGSPEPSRADEYLTSTLKQALALVDVRVIDHIVIGGGIAVSMAERGLL